MWAVYDIIVTLSLKFISSFFRKITWIIFCLKFEYGKATGLFVVFSLLKKKGILATFNGQQSNATMVSASLS